MGFSKRELNGVVMRGSVFVDYSMTISSNVLTIFEGRYGDVVIVQKT